LVIFLGLVGSGMIAPNMATMLAFITTNATIPRQLLQNMLQKCVAKTFNCITVDGDTSTNDACVLIATNKSPLEVKEQSGEVYKQLQQALLNICQQLAQMIIRDGEGAKKFVTVNVKAAVAETEARVVAMKIANSPLVKTALTASDPNWGRIVAAIGNSDLSNFNPARVNIFLNEFSIVKNGMRDPAYVEADGLFAMNKDEITITVDLHRGEAEFTAWTTDLSCDYIKINAEYRT